jgi:hypothetical protein
MPGGPYQAAPAPIQAPVAPRYVAPSSRAVQKSGQVHIYADSEVSPEEKRAKNPKYAMLAQQSAAAPMSAAPAFANAPIAAPAQPASVQAVQPPVAAVQAPQSPAKTAPEGDETNPRVAGQKRARAADLI